MDDAALTREIITTIRKMNRAWTGSWNEEEFRSYIHTGAVAIVPSAPGRLEGKEAYVAGWRDFAAAAKIQSWSERDHHVQIFASGKCAVATYLFTIRFETGGQVQAIEGRDMFFLVKEKGRWLVVADQFSSEPVTG